MEKLLEGFMFLEAPRVDPHGNLYFTDVVLGEVYKRAPDGTVSCLLTGRHMAGGLALNHDGRLVVSGQGGLILLDERSGEQEPLLVEIDGEPVSSVNDIHPDGEGGLYAGMIDSATQEKIGSGKPKPMVLVRGDRSATVVGEPVEVSNGIGLSPDRGTVYQVETLEGVLAFDRAPDGTLSGCRLQIAHPNSDGLAVDVEGGIWVAAVGGGAVRRFLPDGTFDREIAMPEPLVASLSFGGEDLKDMYVVTGCRFDLGHPPAGNVYRIRSDIAGLPTPVTRF